MSARVDLVQFAIHLGLVQSEFSRLEGEARLHGMSVIEIDVAHLPDVAALSDYLATAFMFPHKTVGLDAAVDLISDLEWIGNEVGYVLVARGFSDQSPTAEIFASLLPNIVDRWRAQGVPFVVAIDGKGARLQAVLREANEKMALAGRLPWAQPGTGAVDVVIHSPEA